MLDDPVTDHGKADQRKQDNEWPKRCRPEYRFLLCHAKKHSHNSKTAARRYFFDHENRSLLMNRLKIALLSALLTVAAGAFAGWSGSGSFTRVHDWTDDAAASIKITASRMDAEDDNFTTGINACLAKNGENAATGNLNIGGYRLTSVGAGSAATDAATIGGTETLTNKTISGGTITGITDLAVADGGTGASTAAAARTSLDAQEDVITTRGDLVRGSSSNVPERLARGSAGYLLRSDGTDISWHQPVAGLLMYRTADTTTASPATGTFTDVAFDAATTEVWDSPASHTAGQDYWVVPSGYTYMKVTGVVSFEADATGYRQAQVVTSAGADMTPRAIWNQASNGAAGAPTRLGFDSGWRPVVAAEEYKIQAWQNSGSTLDLIANETWVAVEYR